MFGHLCVSRGKPHALLTRYSILDEHVHMRDLVVHGENRCVSSGLLNLPFDNCIFFMFDRQPDSLGVPY